MNNKPKTQLHKFLAGLLQRNLSTLEAERIVSTTRIANIATKARKELGLTLPCVMRQRVRADGTTSHYHVYMLTAGDREAATKWLRSKP